MRASLILGLSLLTTLPALAQWNKIVDRKTKTLITCTSDREEHWVYADGQTETISTHGKSGRSLRTSTMKDGIEHRDVEYTGYSQNGAIVSVKSNGSSTIETRTNGNEVTEILKNKSKSDYFDDKTGEFSYTKESEQEMESVYRVEGQNRFLIRYVLNGKDEPTYDQVETTTIIDSKTKAIHLVSKTPYTYEISGTKIEVLQDITDCTYAIQD